MATNEHVDLALLTFDCLQNLATRTGIPKADSFSRPDLVGALRKEGIGSHPILEGMTGIGHVTTALAALSSTIMDLNKEIVAIRVGRDDEIASLKLEIQQLRREMADLRDTSVHTQHAMPHQYSDVVLGTATQTASARARLSTTTGRSVQTYGTHAGNGSLPGETRVPQPNTTTSRSSSPAAGVHASRRSSTTTSRSSSPAAGLDASRRSTDTEQQVHEWQEHQGRRTRAAQRQRHAADTSSQSQLAQSITRRVETSRYTKPARDSEPAVDLMASPRAKRKVFYVGNVQPHCSASSIAEWCSARGVQIQEGVIFASKHFRTAYARVTVEAADENTVGDKGFWPDALSHTVRPWRFAADSFDTRNANQANNVLSSGSA